MWLSVFSKKSSNERHWVDCKIEKDSLIYILQSKTSSVLLSCISLCFGVLRRETVFVVTSCQGWLGLCISSDGEEAVRFFCSTVIRHPPPSHVCKCDAKKLKVLSPMIKDSSLSVAIQAPTEQRVQPKEKTPPCHPKDNLTFSTFSSQPLLELDMECYSLFHLTCCLG